MSAISRGKTSRNDIEQSVGRQVSGYLARLEEDYALIVKRIPFARSIVSIMLVDDTQL